MLLVAIVLCPEMILPTVCLYLFLVLLWRYRSRPCEPTGMDPRLSHVDSVSPDELDEEFDGLPSGRPADVVRMRYDRLVCANCAAPVNEGRCPVCRANRARLQNEGPLGGGLNPMTLIALLAILIAAVALLAHQTA
jgi:hypothetical protein